MSLRHLLDRMSSPANHQGGHPTREINRQSPAPLWTDAEVREAASERAAIVEHEGGANPEQASAVAERAAAYYAHLFQQAGCCHPRAGNLCPKGKALRDAYHAACDALPGHDYRTGLSQAGPRPAPLPRTPTPGQHQGGRR